MNDLEKIRDEINSIDQQIADLYEKRLVLMNDVADIKKSLDLPILDKNREEEVIKKNLEYIKDSQYKNYYKDFIQFIMDQGKDIQEKRIGN